MANDLRVNFDKNILYEFVMKNVNIVGSQFSEMIKAIGGGSKVVIMREYSNAPEEILKELVIPQEVMDLKDALNRVQSILGQRQIP